MFNGRRFLGVIPARGGSRGVPGKNIRSLGGRPLIAYTFDQARAVSYLDYTVVSTDAAEIKAVAEKYGINTIDRPDHLATAEARTEEALLHALEIMEERGHIFDYVVVLEPTSPFRSAGFIDKCMRQIIEVDAESLLAVHTINEISGLIDDQGFFRPFVPGQPRRRQERTPSYGEASTIYICRVDYLRRTGSLVAEDWLAVEVPDCEAIDINTLEDFEYCEFLIEKKGKSE